MALIVLLANGILQQIVQPIAYGATLGLHPLAVLVVTIAAGSLFATVGLVLAAPLTAAAVRISADPCPHARQGGGDRQAGRAGSRTGTELAGIGGGASG